VTEVEIGEYHMQFDVKVAEVEVVVEVVEGGGNPSRVATKERWRRPNQGGSGIEEDLTTSVAVAIWRAHNNNLVLRRGQRSDDAIPISD
jgi:hypothetical protein